MQLIRYRPPPPLDASVECFWWSRREEPESFTEHMLPSGNAQLIFALHEAPIICLPNHQSKPLVWSRGIVHGPQWSYYRAGPKPAGTVAGVSFRPGAAGIILGMPITDLTDEHVPIDALWGGRGLAVHDELLSAPGPAAVFRVLERHLTSRLERPVLVHPVVVKALASPSSAWQSGRVGDIQRNSGYSPRHFIALFRAAVGLTPKHYYRLQRFNAALRDLAKGNAASLADIAASAGYSDQPHLNREFREFAGITPGHYRPRDATSILHHRAAG